MRDTLSSEHLSRMPPLADGMRALFFAMLVLLPALPSATADDECAPLGVPVTACASETTYADGSCEAGEGFESGATSVVVAAPGLASIVVTGSYYCYAYGTSSGGENGISAFVSSDQAAAGAMWHEFYYNDPKFGAQRFCFVSSVEPVYASCPAALSPPNPGWGDMLP